MTVSEKKNLLAVAVKAAHAAGDIMRRNRLASKKINEATQRDIKLELDVRCQRKIESMLSKAHPEIAVLGEEENAGDVESELRWVVDPIDGTVNFTEGKSTFCMMLVLVLGGQSVMSWIHDPLTGLTTIAEKGAGAERNGERLPRPIVPALDQMKGQINPGFFPKADRGRLYSQISRRIKTFASLRCAGHDFLGLATGHHHFSVYRRLWTWDHAPGVLIFREVGGVSERLDGGEYRVIDRVEGLLSAPDRDSWEVLRRLLLEPDAA